MINELHISGEIIQPHLSINAEMSKLKTQTKMYTATKSNQVKAINYWYFKQANIPTLQCPNPGLKKSKFPQNA